MSVRPILAVLSSALALVSLDCAIRTVGKPPTGPGPAKAESTCACEQQAAAPFPNLDQPLFADRCILFTPNGWDRRYRVIGVDENGDPAVYVGTFGQEELNALMSSLEQAAKVQSVDTRSLHVVSFPLKPGAGPRLLTPPPTSTQAPIHDLRPTVPPPEDK